MRSPGAAWIAIASVLLVASCHAAPPEALLKVEAEDLPTVSAAAVAEEPLATGGTAVVLSSARSLLAASVGLDAGEYTLLVSLVAPDGSHDAVYLSVPGGEVRRPVGRFGELVTLAQQFIVGQDAGPVALAVRPDAEELGVMVDQVGLVRGTVEVTVDLADLPDPAEPLAVDPLPGGLTAAPSGAATEDFRLAQVPQAPHERGLGTQFLVSFDGSPDADYARGRPGCGTASDAKLVEGRWGDALDCTAHGFRALYSMERNLAPKSGTLEFWVKSGPDANIWADDEDHYLAYLWPKQQLPREPRDSVALELVKRAEDRALHLAAKGAPAPVDLALPTADLDPGTWHHVAISWDCIDRGSITYWLALDGEGRHVTISSEWRTQPFFALQLANAPWLGHYSRAGESAELGGYIDDLHISDEPLGRREEGREPLELSGIDVDLALRARDAFDRWVGVWADLQTGGAWGPWVSPIIDADTHIYLHWTGQPTDRCVVDNKYGSSIVTFAHDFLDVWAYAGDEQCRQIAENAAEFFLRGQDPRGYWYQDYRVSENGRVYGVKTEWARIQDGHQSQPFLFMLYWHRVTGDTRAFEAARRNADFVLSIENPNGAWAGKYNVATETPWTTGPRGVPNGSEFNDYATTDALRMMITMYDLTGDEKYLRGPEGSRGVAGIGQWLYDTQIGEGDVRGWCQQYGPDDRPVWSRDFEAPVISPRVVSRFIHPMTIIMWLATGNQRYMDLLQETYDWYRSVEAPGEDGGWYYQYLPDGRPCTSREFKTVVIDPDHPDGVALTELGDPDSTVVLDADDPDAPRPSRAKLRLDAIQRDLEAYHELGPEGYRQSLIGSSELSDEDYLELRKSALSQVLSFEDEVRDTITQLDEHGQLRSGWNLGRMWDGALYSYIKNLHLARGLASREIFRKGGRSPWEFGGRGWKRPVAAIDDWFDFELEEQAAD